MKKVAILVDTEENRHIADKAVEVLDRYSIEHQIETLSVHKQPSYTREFVRSSDAEIFICVAGMSAALPGIVASITPKPVIGVPVENKMMGLDALLSISQMPVGIPVATMGIDNSKNAAYLALRILALKHPEILSHGQRSESYSSPSSYSEPSVSEYASPERDEYSAPVTMPDFMLSTKPAEPVTFGEQKKEPEKRRREARGDWWM
ncbi:MAG: AIR carboxylase family protein [archaeon]